jgi:glycosyltransferase involved in cell wall biosynthesis
VPRRKIEMRIVIDTHAIGRLLTGNERYIQNVAEHLLALDGKNEYYFFFSDKHACRRWENRARNLRVGLVSPIPFRRLGVDFVVQLRRLRPQLFHYQYTGPLIHVSPEVVTIHDVSFEEHPEFFTRRQRLRLRLTVRRAVRSADRIITVSEFSKAEIIRLFNVPERKIRVIYNGVGPEFRRIQEREAIRRRVENYGIQRPFLLVVGNICGRKNQAGGLRGYARWLSRNKSCEHLLVMVGKPEAYVTDLRREARRLGVGDDRLKFPGFVSDEDLPYLYSGAELLLNTSLYEGFGFPLVEAMQCGLPIIASRASCFPEIAGSAACYVNPTDPDDIAQAIGAVLNDNALRSQLIGAGLQRAGCFKWDVAARETLNVYHEVANGRGHSNDTG